VVKFVNWYRSLDITPTIVALRKKFETFERRNWRRPLPSIPTCPRRRRIFGGPHILYHHKILHDPVTFMKRADEEMMTDLYIDTLRTLFQLPSDEGEGSSAKDEEKPETKRRKIG